MIADYSVFTGNRILGWFLLHPSERQSINQLARTLSISPGSVKNYADVLEAGGVLCRERAGTAHLLSLRNENPVVTAMKRAAILLVISEAGVTKLLPGAISIALYGSMASGQYDGESDIDLLVLSNAATATSAAVQSDIVAAIEEETGFELQVTVLPWHEWEVMKEQGDPFAVNVLAGHVLLAGATL
ncbi:MAG: nucleotidyltransferase domain-containing protein [Methanogenium sp.]|nr:nucleotidyltransferase domain-containing protein [Methanogenium sp.]